MEPLQIEYVDPATLTPAPWNPRTITDEALRRLAAAMDVHGFVSPVVARRFDRLLIGGHQRLAANALRARPVEKIPCVFLDDIDDARARALNVALNSHQAAGEFDELKLAQVLAEIDSAEIDVPAASGLDAAEIEALLAIPAAFEPQDIDPPRLDEITGGHDRKPAKRSTCPRCGHVF